MKIPNIAGLIGVGKAFVMANRPEILFGASVVSTVASVVAAARGGYKSGQQVLRAELGEDAEGRGYELVRLRELSNKEKLQLTWINYLPAAGLTASALGATTGLHIVHVKEKKQLAAVALMAIEEVKKEAMQYGEDIKQAVEENVKLTDAKRDKIDDAIMEKNADRNGGRAIVQDSDGLITELYLVRDAKTGRDIWSNEARIDEAVLRVNELIMEEGSADLNTFYSWAGFNSVPEGNEQGWSGERINVTWDTDTRDDGRPVRQFTFRRAPKSGAA